MRKDIDFSFKKHPITGDISVKTGSSAIKQSLKNLVLTGFYERGFNLDPATPTLQYLFSNMSPADELSLETRIKEVIEAFEPEVTLDRITFKRKNNDLYIELHYFEVNSTELQHYSFQLG